MPVLRSPVNAIDGVATAPDAALYMPAVATVWLPKSGLIFVPAMAAEAFTSALTITPAAIEVALPTEVTSPVRLALVVTFDAVPVKLAVMVPAVKLPLPSRATMALAVFALVAVVAELLTLPAVAIVASLVSTMAAEAFMSALTMVPFGDHRARDSATIARGDNSAGYVWQRDGAIGCGICANQPDFICIICCSFKLNANVYAQCDVTSDSAAGLGQCSIGQVISSS
jgi:hypothetical protein